MALDCSQVANALQCWRCIGFTSFPSVSIWLASQTMGLGTLFPPQVLWERTQVNDMQFLTCCLLAAAPRVTLRDKR